MTDDPSKHYPEFDTETGVHACDDPECLTNGVPAPDLRQLAFALAALDASFEAPDAAERIRTTTFRATDGLYVLLTVPWQGSRAVVGALYTPTLYAALRASGFTVSAEEQANGVN